ncbi:unnamed protein product, partial [Oppiella nova]
SPNHGLEFRHRRRHCPTVCRSGARVVVSGLNGDDISSVAHECSQVSPMAYKPLEVVTDFRIEGDIERLVDTTVHTFGRLDILVNNAGVFDMTDITDPGYITNYNKVIDVNLYSVVLLTQLSVKHLAQTNGNIINISSVEGVQCVSTGLIVINRSAYCMSKSAVIMFTKCMAVELGGKGIRLPPVLQLEDCPPIGPSKHSPPEGLRRTIPGSVRTRMAQNSGISDEVLRKTFGTLISKYPVGRCGEGTDIANAVAFLASDHASFVTGSNLVVDGGHLAAGL